MYSSEVGIVTYKSNLTYMILHIFRVYLTGGFKQPRELTWVTGVIIAICTVSFGVTGYSLPWDQVGYWAVKIVTGVPDVRCCTIDTHICTNMLVVSIFTSLRIKILGYYDLKKVIILIYGRKFLN